MVAGGLEVMSKTTQVMPWTSLTILLLMRASTSYGIRAQSSVIASWLQGADAAEHTADSADAVRDRDKSTPHSG